MKSSDAIVIGSGIAGLATAVRLQAAGFATRVFEANAYPGGKVTEIGGQGYRFDAGPSLFTLPELVEETIQAAGKKVEDYFHYHRHPVACRYFWDDGTELTAWGDPRRFAQEVESKLGVPAARTEKHLAHAARIYRSTTPVFLEKSLHRWKSYLNRDTLKAISQLHRLNLFNSLHTVNHKALQHPKLVQLFDRYATYNGSSPYLTPGVMSSIPHLEHNLGTFYPRGGMHSIPMALYRLAQDLGVRFHFHQPVERILTQDKKVSGVRVEGQRYPASVVVSNADVWPTFRALLPHERAPERVLNQPRSSSALIFYWGMAATFSELDLHNIFFTDDYREEFRQIFEAQNVSDDPTVYVNISSKVEAQDAPPDTENWFVMVNVPPDTGQDWEALTARIRQQVLRKLSARLGRDLAPLIRYEETLDPRKIEQQTASYQGSLYGASSNNPLAAFLRHPNFSPRLHGLYFAGGSVHPGGGVPLCLLSARITASLAIQRQS
ncbi:MAG: 1-hydroxycarotenoid 3,4-desaturase CrtD [Schleiferiaceae bacterium]|nr:1-hydroxycarotenoid 3,4-desaturase CrtD [Schleiferiaceae bacterium]